MSAALEQDPEMLERTRLFAEYAQRQAKELNDRLPRLDAKANAIIAASAGGIFATMAALSPDRQRVLLEAGQRSDSLTFVALMWLAIAAVLCALLGAFLCLCAITEAVHGLRMRTFAQLPVAADLFKLLGTASPTQVWSSLAGAYSNYYTDNKQTYEDKAIHLTRAAEFLSRGARWLVGGGVVFVVAAVLTVAIK